MLHATKGAALKNTSVVTRLRRATARETWFARKVTSVPGSTRALAPARASR
jgi:hypothetical protein